MDSQSIWQNLAEEEVSGIRVALVNRMTTSRASEGVRDGSASKIGVVSGEAIWLKLATASKVWWKADLINRGTNSLWPNG